jgi:serine/threonine protein kinase
VALKGRNARSWNPNDRVERIRNEIYIINQISHPNIIHTHRVVESDDQAGIMMESSISIIYLQTFRAIMSVPNFNKHNTVHGQITLDDVFPDKRQPRELEDLGFAHLWQ